MDHAIASPTTPRPSAVIKIRRDPSKPRMIQHKNEAKTFYRFLSIVYDHIVNPGHWTVDMRTDALEPAKLDDPALKVDTYRTSPPLHSKRYQAVHVCLSTCSCI